MASTATATTPSSAPSDAGKTMLKVSGLRVAYGGIQAVKASSSA